MSRSISQARDPSAARPRVPAHARPRRPGGARRLSGRGDSLAPDAAGDPRRRPPTRAATAEPLGALASDRIAFSVYTADSGTDIWTMGPRAGARPTHLLHRAHLGVRPELVLRSQSDRVREARATATPPTST